MKKDVAYSYRIQGKIFSQRMMTFGQHKRLISLMGDKKVKIKEIFDIDGALSALKFMIDNEIIDDFFRTILLGPVDAIDFNEIDSATLVRILKDFFLCNGAWISDAVSWLRNWIVSLTPKETNPFLAFWLNLTHSAKRK